MRKLILVFILLASIMGHAADLTVDGVAYSWMPDELAYVATGWDEEGPREEVHIYNTVNGLDVTRIATAAFEDNELLRSVEIDEGITAIGENAFCRCHNLRRVVLPEGLEKIGEEAFAFCSALTTVTIPASVTVIESHAFAGCTAVTDVFFRMTNEQQLDDFDWWDGDYPHDGEDDHGGLEFNRSRLRDPENGTIIHVPEGTLDIYNNSRKLEAWLLQEDVAYPLWWIVNFGTVGEVYTVSDDISSIYVDINDDLYAKDDNHRLVPDMAQSGETDFMTTTGLLSNRGNVYDQSNWVAITGLNVLQLEAITGRVIKGGTLSGTLLDKVNPTLAVSDKTAPVAGEAVQYIPNTYIPASFMSRTQQSAGGRTYSFVRPAPQEYMFVTWTIYHDTDDENEFYLPAPDHARGINSQEFAGGFLADYALYEESTRPTLVDRGVYDFNAINRVMPSTADSDNFLGGSPRLKASSIFEPNVDGGLSTQFMPCVLELPDEPIITGVDNISVNTRDNIYFDLQGRHLIGKPTAAGIYIVGGSKIVVF